MSTPQIDIGKIMEDFNNMFMTFFTQAMLPMMLMMMMMRMMIGMIQSMGRAFAGGVTYY